jgi:hypothetical protein
MAETIGYKQAPDLCLRPRTVSRAPHPKAAEIQPRQLGTWFDTFARTGASKIKELGSPIVAALFFLGRRVGAL